MEPQPTGLTAEATKYMPEPRIRRRGLALCLSGGGFRAALFHLGALRRLHELGVLPRLDTISAVSGGSIIAAHLAGVLKQGSIGPADWERTVAEPFRRFAARNLRTGPLLRRYLLPWNWFRPAAAVEALADRYAAELTPLSLPDLPPRPSFIFCATDLVFGVNWIFSRELAGDYQAGYLRPSSTWPVARAVAASSCFPPVFNPLPLGVEPKHLTGGSYPAGRKREALVAGIRLCDGGVYDNLGLEPVWKDHARVLVSDGGAVFAARPAMSTLRQLQRYLDVVANQAEAVRKRWLIANFVAGAMEGTYWGVGSAPASYGAGAPAGYSKAVAVEVVARIRTDLDAFSAAEAAVLENHGYLLAEAAVRRHVPDLCGAGANVTVPHPEWLDEAKARTALRRSHERRLLGRF